MINFIKNLLSSNNSQPEVEVEQPKVVAPKVKAKVVVGRPSAEQRQDEAFEGGVSCGTIPGRPRGQLGLVEVVDGSCVKAGICRFVADCYYR